MAGEYKYKIFLSSAKPSLVQVLTIDLTQCSEFSDSETELKSMLTNERKNNIGDIDNFVLTNRNNIGDVDNFMVANP